MKNSIFIWLVLLSGFVKAQDIEAILKADPLKITGGLGSSLNMYAANGIEDRQQPFYAMVNADLNLNFYGVVDMPFRFSYSPQSTQFYHPYSQQQPFNQFGLTPKYKWLTLHGGFSSMNFSQFTYAGNRFLGGGAEIRPEKKNYAVSAFYGRLAEKRDYVMQVKAPNVPDYDRWGWGAKAEYWYKNQRLEVIVFQAWDKYSNIPLEDVTPETKPMENTVFSVKTRNKLPLNLSLGIESSWSALNPNRLAEESPNRNIWSVVMRTSDATTAKNAIKTDLTLPIGTYNIGLNYRRIAPDYQSLGVPFMANDMEDATVNVAGQVFKKKLSFSTSLGMQRNNLSDKEAAKMKRVIGSINANYSLGEKFNFNGAYSNFSTTTHMVRIEELDSLNYYQVTQNFQLGGTYVTGLDKVAHVKKVGSNRRGLKRKMSDEVRNRLQHNINWMFAYQTANDIYGAKSELYNGNVAYNYRYNPWDLSTSASINYNQSTFTGIENHGIGPGINASKSWFDKLVRTSVALTYLNYRNNGRTANHTWNARLNIGTAIKKVHQLSLTTSLVSRNDLVQEMSFSEFKSTFNYSYRFSK